MRFVFNNGERAIASASVRARASRRAIIFRQRYCTQCLGTYILASTRAGKQYPDERGFSREQKCHLAPSGKMITRFGKIRWGGVGCNQRVQECGSLLSKSKSDERKNVGEQ